MAKKKRKSKKEPEQQVERTLWSLLAEDESEAKAKLTRLGIVFAVIAFVCGGVCYGLTQLEGYVHGLDRYDQRLGIQFVNQPDWLQLDANKHIFNSLAVEAGLRGDDHMLDPDLAKRIGVALSQPHVGWIESVNRITVEPTGLITADCTFRRPTAWVHYGQYCYLVDRHGVRLPGCYSIEDCRQNSLLMVTGVTQPPPGVGRPWTGADVTSGLKMVDLLCGEPYRHQIQYITVANHDGRVNRHEPHIELITDRLSSRIKWGRPPEEEFGTEITAAQKITLLRKLYQNRGRIDMNCPYVDVRTWSDRVAMPAMMQSAKGTRLIRG